MTNAKFRGEANPFFCAAVFSILLPQQINDFLKEIKQKKKCDYLNHEILRNDGDYLQSKIVEFGSCTSKLTTCFYFHLTSRYVLEKCLCFLFLCGIELRFF